MKFKTIKSNALQVFSEIVDCEITHPSTPSDSSHAVGLCIRTMAGDLGMSEDIRCSTLAQIKARGAEIIKNWDARNVGRLISIFPVAAPSLLGRALQVYMADTDNCDWIVVAA